MIQVDLPAAFAIGQTFSMLSRNYLKKEPEILTNKLLGPFNIYLTTGFVPGGLFLLAGWPAWEAMYTSPCIENNYNNPVIAAVWVLFVIAMILCGNFGYMLGHYFYKKNLAKYVKYTLSLGVILTFLPFLIRWGCWEKIGTFAEVKAGGGYPFGEEPFFTGWICIMSYLFIAGIIAGVWFLKKSKKLLNC
ncbi:MAG: hypothetical protein PHD97_08715 [Bacteroidales bacterium]|nr:hypothetical protein [Bacteroidales bacterium]